MRNYEYLVAVAEQGHFGRAAERCCVTQPTLSLGIKELERQLGFDLVRRDRRYIGLTAEGEIVVSYAKRLIKTRQELGSVLERHRREADRPLLFGAVPSGVDLVAHIATELSRDGLSKALSVVIGSRDEVAQAVADGKLDVGVTFLRQPNSGVDVLAHISDDEACVVGPRDVYDPPEVLTFDDMARLPLCHLPADNYGADIAAYLAGDAGRAGQPRMSASSVRSVLAHLDKAYWCALVPRSVLGDLARDPSVWVRRIEQGSEQPRLVVVARPAAADGDRRKAMVERVKALALQYCDALDQEITLNDCRALPRISDLTAGCAPAASVIKTLN